MDQHTVPPSQRSGILLATPLEGGRVVQSDTVSCCHCGYTWVFVPGSGRRRGFCLRCNHITCGRECCERMGCVPQEQQLENMEAFRPIDFRPIVGRVDVEPPRG